MADVVSGGGRGGEGKNIVNMSSMGLADLVIAIAYFFIPLEMVLYLLRRR